VRRTVTAALKHSAVIRRAQADLAGTGVDVKIAYGGYQPQLQSSAGVGANQSYDYAMSVAQPLYDWGRTGANVSRAKAQMSAAEAALLDAAEKTALEAVQAHLSVRRSESLVAAAQENLTAHRRFTELAGDRTSGGVGDATEVELAGIHQGEAESALEDARGALRNARSVYYTRVGLEPSGLGSIPELPLFMGADRNVDAAALEAPAVVAARARQKAAQSAAKVERADLLPKISAEAYVRGNQRDNDPQTGVGLRVTGPTLAGLSNFSRVEAANLQADSAKWAAEAARRDATMQARELFDHEPTLRGRIRILDAQLVKARALRDLYEDQFKIGERKVADLVNVQADVFRIERSLINARFDILDLQYKAAAALGYLVDALQMNLQGEGQ
jgi:outer membrane protein, adhesin transport system